MLSKSDDMEILNVTEVLAFNKSFIARHATSPADTVGGTVFFDTYFSTTRFAIESVVAVMGSVANVAALVAIASAPRSQHTVYRTLFVNLAIVNIIACVLSWLCNNTLFLFQRNIVNMLRRGATLCWTFVVLVSAVFASSLFGLVSTLTMLGLTTVQYIAICRPLDRVALASQTRVYRFIACTWLLSMATCFTPLLVVVAILDRSECVATTLIHIERVIIGAVNTFVAVVFMVHVVMFAQCVKIHFEIGLLRKRLSQFRFREDVMSERKAFVTTVALLTTMAAFFLPYCVFYVITINHINQTLLQSDVLIYYMNLLPYLKFLSDPIVYGMRNVEVREGCFRLLARCACPGGGGSVRGSVATSEYQMAASSSTMTQNSQSGRRCTASDVASV